MTTRQAKLARLRALFVEDALAELAEVERLAAAPRPGSAGLDSRRLRKLVHDLRGSGGSYGFPGITEAAAALEAALAAPGPGETGGDLTPLVAALGAAIRAAARGPASGAGGLAVTP